MKVRSDADIREKRLTCPIYDPELTSYEDSCWRSIVKRKDKREREVVRHPSILFISDVSDIHFLPRDCTCTHTPVSDHYSSS